jgi:phosphoserine phosphatase
MAIILDFDKTLTKRDSLTLFTLFLWRGKYVDIYTIVKLLFLSAKYVLKKIDNNEFKNSYFLLLQVQKDEIYRWFDEYLESHLFKKNLNISANILSLQSDNKIVVVTASPAYYVSKVFPKINVIGGELLFDKSDFCCGYKNCYADSKVANLLSKNVVVDYVFTDSTSDMPLIKVCKKKAFIVKNGSVKKIIIK